MTKRTKPWIQVDADFTQSIIIRQLERRDKENRWRMFDLICCARLCNREGRLVDMFGRIEIPHDAVSLSGRIWGDEPERYQAFLDLLLSLGVLTRGADGVLTLSDWELWWGSLAKTDAERQTARRERKNLAGGEETVDDGSTDPGHDVSRQDHEDVTKERDMSVTRETPMSRPSHDDVTISALQNRTEQDNTQHNTTGQQNKTEQSADGVAGLVSPDAHGFHEYLDEESFWLLIPDLYEYHIGKSWTPADRRKFEKSLREPWAKVNEDRAVRYLAIRYGFRYLAGEMKALAIGKRVDPIDSPLGLGLAMSAKYAQIASEDIARMRSERATGKIPEPPRFRKLRFSY